MLRTSLRTTAILLSLSVSHMAFAGDLNTLRIEQEGNYAAALVSQDGNLNKGVITQKNKQTRPTANQYRATAAELLQVGDRNDGNINQDAQQDQTYIRAGVKQWGTDHKATVNQQGGESTTVTFQYGANNTLTNNSLGYYTSLRGVQDGQHNNMTANITSESGYAGGAIDNGVGAINFVHARQLGDDNQFTAELRGQEVHVTGSNVIPDGNVQGALQQGNGNQANISASGQSARVDEFVQRGDYNSANMTIHGTELNSAAASVSVVKQEGNNNAYTLFSDGTDNVDRLTQNGNLHDGNVNIVGRSNRATITQAGNMAAGGITQQGNSNNALIKQSNIQTRAAANQTRATAAEIRQYGNNNEGTISQNALQDQTYIRDGIKQWGDRNKAAIEQSGGEHTAVTFQYGQDNVLTNNSSGYYTSLRGVQDGQRNQMNTTIASESSYAGGALDNGVGAINFVHIRQLGNDNQFNATLRGQEVHVDGTTIIPDGNIHGAIQQGNANQANITLTGGSARVDEFIQRGDNNRADVNIHGPYVNTSAPSVANIRQDGTNNGFSLMTDGANNVTYLTQSGNNNQASASAMGDGNRVTIGQNGSDNHFERPESSMDSETGEVGTIPGDWSKMVDIRGNNNSATITQNGIGNVAGQYIRGDNNTLAISQTGNYNRAFEIANGSGNNFNIAQTGNNNSGMINVQGSNNNFSINQNGNGLNYDITRVGNGGMISITQSN